MKDFSYVTNSHPAYVESLYEDYKKGNTDIDPEWQKFFDGFDFALSKENRNGSANAADGVGVSPDLLNKEFNVYQLICNYHKRGHLIAKTNPIRERKDRKARLELAHAGLSDSDLDTAFYAGEFIGLGKAKLSEIITRLQKLYAGDVGIQFTYINNPAKCAWVQQAFEAMMEKDLTYDERKRVLEKLNEGVIFEKFLHTKYI